MNEVRSESFTYASLRKVHLELTVDLLSTVFLLAFRKYEELHVC